MARNWVFLAALFVAVPAAALNMSGFKDAPVTRLTGPELKTFREAVMKALDETPDGATTQWQAPQTRFTSKITPQKTFTDGKQRCREATIESEAHDRYQRGLYTFCKGQNGEWQFRLPTGKPKKK